MDKELMIAETESEKIYLNHHIKEVIRTRKSDGELIVHFDIERHRKD